MRHRMAGTLNLDTVVVGAYNDNEVKKIASLEKDEEPLYIMPLGKKTKR